MKRHKQPSLVSMWMLDVFCCALGCVTLLWLLKTREAGQALDDSADAHSQLVSTQSQLDDMSKLKIERDNKIDELLKQLTLVEKARDEQARQLALTREELDKTGTRLALVEQKATDSAKELALTQKKLEDEKRALSTLEAKVTTNEEELTKKKTEIAALNKQIDLTKAKTDDAERLVREREKERDTETKRVAELNKTIEAMNRSKTETDKQSSDLAKALEQLKKLEQQLGDSNTQIVDLQGAKAKLADKLNRIEIESQQKFAGISLTGKRVVFMVDMSGSMEMIDEKTTVETKWPLVRDTLVKVMRSLPDLEKFQILVFSSRVMYLLPESKDWIDYDKVKTPDIVHNAMTVLKPQGDTNMFAAFEECFKYRSKGMDAIYLFSDGLPNSGPGLTEAQIKAPLSDSDRQTLLGKHILQLLQLEWNRTSLNQPKVRINSIGFYFESPDLGAFLWALARANDGSFVGMSKP